MANFGGAVGGNAMGTPVRDGTLTPKDLKYYAPRKLRDAPDDTLSLQPPPITNELQSMPTSGDTTLNDNDIAALPDMFHPPASNDDLAETNRAVGLFNLKSLVLFGGAALAGLFIGINILDAIQGRNEAPSTKDPEIPLASRLQSATTDLQSVSQPIVVPLLTAADASGDMNVPLPLGLSVKNYTADAMVDLSGLPRGTVLNTGSAMGTGQWRIAVDDLPKTRITPPVDYAGTMTLTAQIAGANGKTAVRTPVRLIWRQAPTAPDKTVGVRTQPSQMSPAKISEPAPPPAKIEAPAEPKKIEKPPEPAKTEAPVLPRKLEAAEIALLLRRADEVMAKGDLAAARLLLQRVAETKNARAAFQLGSTYDPTVIKKFANNSIAADPALAQFWYERARDWGSPDAAGPLEALASHAVGK